MFGNGFCGIIIGVFRAITLAVFPGKSGEFKGTLVYFIFSSVFLIFAIFMQIKVSHHGIIDYYVHKAHKITEQTERRTMYGEDEF